MTKAEVEHFFRHYFWRMKRDVAREIQWQRDHPRLIAGNLLCGLALVAYTEVMGRLALGHTGKRVANRTAFNEFLDRFDAGSYRRWRLQWETPRRKLYDVLRNGLVHEYVPKVNARLWFAYDEPFGLRDRAGVLEFNIAPYHRHFSDAGDQLRKELLA